MIIQTARIILRDFEPADRSAFVAYQMDPRYRRLYDLDDDPGHAHRLFDLFQHWRGEKPRHNFQLGVFLAATNRLCGSAGLRECPVDREAATFGLELAPSEWGRYRIALDTASSLLEYGFESLNLRMIVGDTSSGNRRVEKLARWFGAQLINRREGPEWMRARGWEKVDWALTRDGWLRSREQQRGSRPAQYRQD